MISLTIAKKYAKALLEIGLQDGNYETLGQDLNKMADLLKESKELREALQSPPFPKPNRMAIGSKSVKGSALRSVLYEMVTGRQAFTRSSSLPVLAKILNEEPAPPGRMSAAVPPELEKAILRCLRKDPARRYQTMADLKVALEDLVAESSPVTPVPPVAPPTPSRWKWAVAVLVPLLLIAVYFAARTPRAPASQEHMHAVPLTALSGQVRYPKLSPDGNHVAFTWTGAAQDNPDVYVQQIGAGSPLRLTTDPAGDSTPAWAPC